MHESGKHLHLQGLRSHTTRVTPWQVRLRAMSLSRRARSYVPLRRATSDDPAMALDGIIFDLDGTLVDTNALHVEAWRRVLEKHGYRVAADRIMVEVGKGGDNLVPDLLGEEADQEVGEALRAEHPKAFG